jgi:haloacid dehalogenase superfamily, subfamily IA, variant 3 with third motif having DD or ED
MNDLEAILFDLDGVIIDSEPLHEKAFRQTSLHLGRDLTQEEVASLKGTVDEIGAVKLLEYNPVATLSVPQVMEYYNNIYKAMFDQIRLIPGSREFIQKAHRKDLKLGLTTSALQENQQRIFERFNLWPFFSTTITGQDIINGKPHPEPSLKTAEKLGVAPANALVIEDSVNGVRSGKAAGCRVIAITTSFPRERLMELQADYVVDSFAELERLFGFE